MMGSFLFWTWPILLFFAIAIIKGIFGKPRIKPGYAGYVEQENKNKVGDLVNDPSYSGWSGNNYN